MKYTEQRKKLREVLNGVKCICPASVYDPLSARIAESVGYEFGVVGGSAMSYSILAAPDLIVLTLTELAEQLRRIMRTSKLSLVVDADHGYGNALNVMRTVEELEHAGISGLMIEDTVLPCQFRQEVPEKLISIEEGVAKLRAAVAARRDPSLVIVGRTSALNTDEGIEGAIARAKAYATTGIDAFYLVGPKKLEHVQAIRAATNNLPLVTGSFLKLEELAANGVRIIIQGHQPVAAAAMALREIYMHLFSGGTPNEYKSGVASTEQMEKLFQAEHYRKWQQEFLHSG